MGKKEHLYCDIKSFHQAVTGSCTQVCVHFPDGTVTRFIVDCGLLLEKKTAVDNENLSFNPEKVDFAVVTHNHADHTGRLPLMTKNGFRGKIYSSSTNCDLMPLLLENSAKILKTEAKIHKKKLLYSDNDVCSTIALFEKCNWEEPIKVSENITLTFFMNGHLLGAALVLVQISFPEHQDINLLFTGDYNYHNIFFDVRGLPQWVLDLPITVITESTYGTTNSKDIKEVFCKNIIEATNNDATVIIPVFSQGRAQTIMQKLKSLQITKKLSDEIPIFLDGNLTIKFTEKYKNSPDIRSDMRNFTPDNFTYVDEKDLRTALLHNSASKIVLTSSGMGTHGPSQLYLPEYITRKNALIHFTGYCAEETLGRSLITSKKTVTIGGRILNKSSQVETTSEFSAHAKSDELIEFLQSFSQLKLVLINHGEPEVKRAFAETVLDEVKSKGVGILGENYAFRVNAYGFVKSLPM